jgi:hypothetical protein
MSAMLVGPKLGRDSEEDLNMIGLSSHPNSLYQYPWSQKFSSGDELAISDDADMHDVSIDDAFALARSADAGMPGGETKSMSIAVPQVRIFVCFIYLLYMNTQGGRSTSDEKVQTPPPACIVNPMTPRSIAHQLFPTPEREAGLGEMAASASQPVASDGKRAEAIAMLRRWREGPLAAYHEGVLRAEAEIVTGHTEAAREFQEELDAVYAEIRRLNGV